MQWWSSPALGNVTKWDNTKGLTESFLRVTNQLYRQGSEENAANPTHISAREGWWCGNTRTAWAILFLEVQLNLPSNMNLCKMFILSTACNVKHGKPHASWKTKSSHFILAKSMLMEPEKNSKWSHIDLQRLHQKLETPIQIQVRILQFMDS